MYELAEVRQRLVKENAEWASRFPASDKHFYRLRQRLDAIRDLLEEYNAIQRGKNNRILLTEDGYQILRRLIQLNEGRTIERAAKMVRQELAQDMPSSLEPAAKKWINHRIALSAARQERKFKDMINDLEKRVEQLEKLHRHWLPWHRLPKGK